MARPIDLSKLTAEQLKNLLANAQRRREASMINAVIREMTRRGIATRREYRILHWNRQRVRETMKPFEEAASAVRGNQRTSYTPAGGLGSAAARTTRNTCGIDTYFAIKTSRINAAFACYIKLPGGEPEFHLDIGGKRVRSYNAAQLSNALNEWQSLARNAVEPDGTMGAHPISGEIDYLALGREHLERYPKIRAALAK